MKLLDYKVTLPSLHTPLSIIPFGCVHADDPGFNENLFEECIQEVKSTPNCIAIGLGDYCLPLEAEILTRDGFKQWDAISIGDEVCAFDGEELTWTPLRAIHKFECSKFIQLKSKSFNAICTPQHSWFVTTQGNSVPKLVVTEDLKSNYRLLMAAKCEDSGLINMTEEEAELIGWIVTDGCVRISPTLCVSISQSKEPYKSRLRDKFSEWFTAEYNYEYLDGCSSFHFKTSKVRDMLLKYGLFPGTIKQQLPFLVPKLGSKARHAMYMAMLWAEGWQELGHWRFSQKPGPVMDAFMVLATLEGARLGLGKWNKAGVLTVPIMDYRCNVNVANLKVTDVRPGPSWCPQTDYGSWVFKLGAQIGVTGNSNLLRTTARKHMKSYTADEDSWRDFDHMVRDKAKDFVKRWLMPIKHKLVGLAEGNHFFEFSQGGTDTQYMCQLLDVPYLDKPAFIRLKVGGKERRKEDDTIKTFRILIHHGDWSGGYSRSGGDINSIENKVMGFDFDIYIFSHTHRKLATVLPSLTIPTYGDLRVVERPRVFLRTGTFMRGYTEKCEGRYAEKKLLPPTDLGYVKLTIKFNQNYDPEVYKRARQTKTAKQARGAHSSRIAYKFECRI